MQTPNDKLHRLLDEFRELLGAEQVPDEQALRTAFLQPAYAEQLMANRNNPEVLAQLLAHPPKQPMQLGQVRAEAFSTAQLASRAGRAMWHWARSGFGTVSETVLRQREAACLVCPNLAGAQLLVQKIISSPEIADADGQRLGNSICAVCGCSLKRKIRLTTESCPQPSDDNPALNRWGEPVE